MLRPRELADEGDAAAKRRRVSKREKVEEYPKRCSALENDAAAPRWKLDNGARDFAHCDLQASAVAGKPKSQRLAAFQRGNLLAVHADVQWNKRAKVARLSMESDLHVA